MGQLAYRRALLKLSGESLKGQAAYGLDADTIRFIAGELQDVVSTGVELALVVGGGNIWRGQDAAQRGMDRAAADYAGMLATLINALALQDALEQQGLMTRTQTAIHAQAVAEPYIRRRAIRHMEKGRVVIFAGGTGNPYMTTDTAAALRAVEIKADVLLMAKNHVDGVYDKDPRKHVDARRFERLGYLEAINLRLDVMDSTALSLCMDNHLPAIVFDLFHPGNAKRVLFGEKLGTLITGEV